MSLYESAVSVIGNCTPYEPVQCDFLEDTTLTIVTVPSCGSEIGSRLEVRTSPIFPERPDATRPKNLRRNPSSSSPTVLSSVLHHTTPQWSILSLWSYYSSLLCLKASRKE
ncbi:hypothetical protein HNY73_016935 [Argiope bruennichi]|uniref:Uncharacterized protein n=1 Tax=Argiope bruennichi TaxID=94029 RepID=A0A8T0ELJ6_ARGBR|nr:hypothetical protein HNY73_016935 [Argiope bruennichi]